MTKTSKDVIAAVRHASRRSLLTKLFVGLAVFAATWLLMSALHDRASGLKEGPEYRTIYMSENAWSTFEPLGPREYIRIRKAPSDEERDSQLPK